MSTFQKEILLCHIDYQKIAVYSRQRLIILKAVSIIKWNILVGQDITIYAALNALTGHLVVFARQVLEAQIIDAALGSVA